MTALDIDNGGAAFPQRDIGAYDAVDEGRGPQGGMSLRDYFAGQAMIALMEAALTTITSPSFLAQSAYQMADAMLAERSRTE